MVIHILFLTLILIFIVSITLTKDIFSPICMICESYILAVFLAILNIKKWLIDLSWTTYSIIIIGILIFIIPETIIIFINKIKKRKPTKINKENNYTPKVIEYSKQISMIFLIIQFIFIISYFTYIGNKFDGVSYFIKNFSKCMEVYRMNLSFRNTETIPFIYTELSKIYIAYIYILTYIEIYNITISKNSKKKYKSSKSFIVSAILFLIQTILSTGRSEMVVYFIYCISLYSLFYYNYYKKFLPIKKITKVIVIVFVFLFCFSSFKEIVGRTSRDFVDDISMYFGGSIELLDLYIEHPPKKSNVFGNETFYSIYTFLNRFNIVNKPTNIHLEFRRSNSINLGNVYTAFRRYYQDFGWKGIIILQIIFSIIINLLYQKTITEESQNYEKIPIHIIYYALICHCVMLHSYSDFFYTTMISVSIVRIFIYIFIIKKILKVVITNDKKIRVK